MRKSIFLAIAVMGAFFIGCTNPNLQNGRETKAQREPLEEHQTAAENTTEEIQDIRLEPVGVTPIELPDSTTNDNDMTVAVDDYIWRELSIAQEYYTMGVVANRESAWEEAQFYFEKALDILGELDIVTEIDSSAADSAVLTPEAARYNAILADIIVNYRQTLLSLGHLPGDISADALIARYSEVNHIAIDTAEFSRLEKYAEEKVSYNVPIIMNERVKKSILYYQTMARDVVKKYLSRSTKFLPLIDSIFAEYDLPTDIKYLALVESGYNPNAYSWARAMGLWQFIASTGRLYGMHRNWWYDERKDPVKATIAAARFLKDLYKEFGSWELAMAAYNGGPGRVRRQIRRQKTRDFWKLDLRKQTEDYVPFFMAATVISKNPEKFGFDNIDYQPRWEYDLVEIDRCLDLKVIAEAIGCTISDLKTLNPELLRRFTPPSKKNYSLRIPKGKKSAFLAAYNDMPSSKETSFVRHKIRRGETVSSIARQYGVSQYAVLEANNLRRTSKIYAGKNLIVPVPNDRSYTRKTHRNYNAHGNVYIVRAGDTVWDIARAFGTSTYNIRNWNNLDRRARIYVGQELYVGNPGAGRTASQRESASGQTTTYTVRKGDTLWEIAQKFGLTTSQLKSINGMGRSSRIYPGQRLNVVYASASSGGGSYLVYTVKRGDTLSEIARQFRVPVAKLMAWNDVTDPRSIPVGFRLKIYNN